MFQANLPTSRIDEDLLLAGAFWLVLAVGLAVVSGLAGNALGLPHAYAFVAGFCGSSVMGLTYRLFPAMKASRLAKPQFWSWEIGLVLLVGGRLLEDFNRDNALVQFASIVAGFGAVLFAANLVQGRTVRADR